MSIMIKSPFSMPEYVTLNDFNEFRGEMRNFRFDFGDFKEEMHIFKEDMQSFRSETTVRFDGIDKRFDGVDKRLDALTRSLADFREEVPRHNTLLRDGFKDNLAIVFDSMKSLDEKIDRNHNELVGMINDLKR